MDKSNQSREPEDSRTEDKGRKGREQFKCGQIKCQKLYHSYTAFYNHCKKAHNGEFPASSLLNNQIFDGPTKNRGRPRIKKNEVKNQYQIQSMKTQNELIEFLGTLRNNTNRSNQQLISYVENPAQRIVQANEIVKEWRGDDPAANAYLDQIKKVNDIICENDLPQFYDPTEFQKFSDRVDSYNFNSIYKFFKKMNKVPEYLQILLICWLTRILSLKLLTQTIFLLLQRRFDGKVTDEKDLFEDKSKKFLALVDSYLDLIEGEHNQDNRE